MKSSESIIDGEKLHTSSAHGRLQQRVAHYPPTPSAYNTPGNNKRFSVPERTAPSWRFVRNAKKSEGYSSVSAGRIVQGEFFAALLLSICEYWKEIL